MLVFYSLAGAAGANTVQVYVKTLLDTTDIGVDTVQRGQMMLSTRLWLAALTGCTAIPQASASTTTACMQNVHIV